MLLLLVPYVYAGKDIQTYQVPDVKNDFCGVDIDFKYCKCAFHSEYCNELNLDSEGAHSHVLTEFREWNRKKIQQIAEACLRVDGSWDKDSWTCTMCTDGDIREGTKCVPFEKVDSEVKECKEAMKNIKNDWIKYSDFDDRLGGEVSYEVQQFNVTLNEIADLVARAHQIKYDMAIEAEIRLEMREYKTALVQNLRNNITKAIFRLAWVTYNTVQGGRGTAGSVQKMLSPDNVVEGVGATMKVVQAHIPPHEKALQFNTASTTGKIGSIAWNATLETIESVANPAEIAKQGMKDIKVAIAGGPDITDEEVAILKEQHLSNKAIDEALAVSYAESATKRIELLEIENRITDKYNLLQEWKFKEYQRVKDGLENQCKDKG